MALAPAPHPDTSQPRHLRAVPPPNRRLATVLGLTVGLSVIAVLFGLALFNAFIVQRQTTLDDLNQQLTEVTTENVKLRLAVSEAEAPERIVSEAQNRLGMVEPVRRVYLTPVTSGSENGE